MIIHAINVHTKPPPPVVTSQTKERINGKVGSQTHKRQIFNLCLKANRWQPGDHVIYDKRPAQVLNVAQSFDDDELIKWDKLKCLYIEIFIYPNEMILVHHNDLKRPKR